MLNGICCHFQNTMYVIFKMMGFYTEVERTTHRSARQLSIILLAMPLESEVIFHGKM